jgi:hypothetical protein
MTFRNDPLFEMLDIATADRMLDGTVLPGDAPPGYERVALLLSALSVSRPPAGAAAMAPRTATLPRISRRRRRPVLLATVVAAVILSSTAGAAFANILPDEIGRPLPHLIQHIGHPLSPAERHTATVTTRPADMPASEWPRRETAAQRSHDRPRTGSAPSAPIVPSDSGEPYGASPTLPRQSHMEPTGRPTQTVPTPQTRPRPDPSNLRSAVRSAADTHPRPV